MSERPSPAASRRVTPVSVAREREPREFGVTGGVVIAVFGARADVGVTTIATALARIFRSLCDDDVALAELDPRVVRARAHGLTPRRRQDASRRATRPPVSAPEPADASDRITIPGANAALVRQSDGI